METQTKHELAETYPEYTDKYFLRAKQILEAEDINPIVRYQVFARQNIPELKGVEEAVGFIQDVAGDKIKIYSLRDGQDYTAKEPIMKLEGRVQDLVDLETAYLEILSGRLTDPIDMLEVRKNARDIRDVAEDKLLLYFGARHFGYWDDAQIAKICQEEGFAGCSTDIGAKAWNSKGGGTVPHASVLAYASYMDEHGIQGNPTVEAVKGFDKYIDSNVPRVLLNCTFNREITDTIETARAVPSLVATRIDTCGENYTQNALEFERRIKEGDLPKLDVDPKYLAGKGVTIASVWELRRGLDNGGAEHIDVFVSSGFNAEKTRAFMKADKTYKEMYGKPLFTGIGTGSLVKSVTTTSDICAYYNEQKRTWKPMSKTGRAEIPSNKLEEIK